MATTVTKLDIAFKAPGLVARKLVATVTTTTVQASTFTATAAFGETFKAAPTIMNHRLVTGTYARKVKAFVDTVSTTGLTVGVASTATADLPDGSVDVEVIYTGQLN